jgi:serine/threonine protein kinase
MTYKYKINEKFKNFEKFTLDIENLFNIESENIHKARNELKIIEHDGLLTVVKSFKVPHFINKIVYTYFKDTKAKKSYEYSLRIGEFTPKPISYIEFYDNGLLGKSYFISEKFDYDFTIREPLLDTNFEDKETILKSFAKFTYELHENQIFHQDYSPGNILVKKQNDGYIFKIVDINRMKFIPLDIEARLKNFAKLWMKDDDLIIVAKEYSGLIGMNESEATQKALQFSQAHKDKINMKKRIKGIPVVD